MDIMRPPLEQQVSPAPWLVSRSNVDVPALIRQALAQQSNANVNDIVRQLSDWGVQASGIVVSMWMMRSREQAADATADHGQQLSVATRAIESYCTCDQKPCSCGKPRPAAWWHQYCCGVRVTPAQAKARDEFFEHAAT